MGSPDAYAYTIHKKKYRCIWSTPIDQVRLGQAEVMPHGSIVTQWCVTELKALKEAVEHTGVRDAALEYQKLEALGSVDPVCKKAIEELKLDATLQKVAAASRKVWVSKSEMIMYITSGAAASCGVITMVLMNDKTPGIICLVGALMIGLFGRLMLR